MGLVKKFIIRYIPDFILYRLSQRIAKVYSRTMTWYLYGKHHNARIDPFNLLTIDPTEITHRVFDGQEQFKDSDLISEVVDGSWDEGIQDVSEYDLYRAIVSRIQQGTPWEETAFYKRVQERFKSGDFKKWGCSTFEEFLVRLDTIDELHKHIESVGYRSQRELRATGNYAPANRDIHYLWPPELHEITICIGRDGELLLYEGRHRFSIARGLELSEIPVRVKARHADWQERRNRYVRTGEIEDEFINHPDIKNINNHRLAS